MKSRSFLAYERPLLTCMVQANNPSRIKELIDLSLSEGAEAFGMQFCRLNPEYRTPKVYRELFSFSSLPTYVTNYRYAHNEGKSDDEIKKIVEDAVNDVNRTLPSFKHMSAIEVRKEEFEKTSSKKIKRFLYK